MGGVISMVEATTTVATWPAVAASKVTDQPMTAAGGVAAAIGVPYLLLGNPIPLLQQGDFINLGIYYVIGGVAFLGVSTAADKMSY